MKIIDAVSGETRQEMAFDAWGDRRNPDTWAALSTQPTDTPKTTDGTDETVTNRGYTGHQMLDHLNLVHMNGRIYSSVLGRFLSADPLIQAPNNLQSYNRYTYVINNPLSLTDPSGFSWFSDIVKKVVNFVKENWVMILTIALVAFTVFVIGPALFGANGLITLTGTNYAVAVGALSGFVGGFAGTLLAGGTLRDAFKAGALGAIQGAITASIGQSVLSLHELARAVAHGVVQGGFAEVTGGSFKDGFIGGFAGSLASHVLMGGNGPRGPPSALDTLRGALSKNIVTRTITAAVIGGTTSALSGGKFSTGAVAAAFQHLFNDEVTRAVKHYEALEAKRLAEILERTRAPEGPIMGHSIAAKNHHYRNAENDAWLKKHGLYGRSDITKKEIEGAGDFGMKKASGPETRYHRTGKGNEHNVKYTSKARIVESWFRRNISNRYGRYEFIGRPNGDGTFTHVNDAVNMGTLNRGNNPITHYPRDMAPFYEFGNR